MSAAVQVGQLAPDFTLPSTAGAMVTLSALRGRPVLLAFFPAAFTGTCTAEMCEFSADRAIYAQRDVTVLPISVDLIPSLTAYRDHERLTVELLSDFRREVSRSYGVLDEARYQSRRAYFLIDAAGELRWAHVEAHGRDKRSTAELMHQVEALG